MQAHRQNVQNYRQNVSLTYKTSQAHRQNVQDFINIVTRFGVFYMYLFLREDKVSVGTSAFRNSHQHFVSR